MMTRTSSKITSTSGTITRTSSLLTTLLMSSSSLRRILLEGLDFISQRLTGEGIPLAGDTDHTLGDLVRERDRLL